MDYGTAKHVTRKKLGAERGASRYRAEVLRVLRELRYSDREPMFGAGAQVSLLVLLWASVGLSPVGWLTGAVYVVFFWAILTLALRRARIRSFGPANWITLSRATLVSGITALVAESLIDGDVPVAALLSLAIPALILDWFDGRVARRNGVVSGLGARFDMEVDAFLILVLSIHVSATLGAWVLSIGAMRYVFALASRVMPWLRAQLPLSFVRKVVAALQGIVLVLVATGLVPRPIATVLVVLALVLLVWSFGRDVRWLWRNGRLTKPISKRKTCHSDGDRLRSDSAYDRQR